VVSNGPQASLVGDASELVESVPRTCGGVGGCEAQVLEDVLFKPGRAGGAESGPHYWVDDRQPWTIASSREGPGLLMTRLPLASYTILACTRQPLTGVVYSKTSPCSNGRSTRASEAGVASDL
jgi:hypothetical protein